jgi:hypothetical protein
MSFELHTSWRSSCLQMSTGIPSTLAWDASTKLLWITVLAQSVLICSWNRCCARLTDVELSCQATVLHQRQQCLFSCFTDVYCNCKIANIQQVMWRTIACELASKWLKTVRRLISTWCLVYYVEKRIFDSSILASDKLMKIYWLFIAA